MAAGKATTWNRCSHRQGEEHGCCGEAGRADIKHQVFRPHFKFSHPSWFECAARRTLAGSDTADCELLPQEPDKKDCSARTLKSTS